MSAARYPSRASEAPVLPERGPGPGRATQAVDGTGHAPEIEPPVGPREGRGVTTVEGPAEDGEPLAGQRAFVERDVFRYGLRAPGRIMSAEGPL